jgi:hypothetical protein
MILKDGLTSVKLLKNAWEAQSKEASDVGWVSFRSPGTTESVAGGVKPARAVNLMYKLEIWR